MYTCISQDEEVHDVDQIDADAKQQVVPVESYLSRSSSSLIKMNQNELKCFKMI